MQLRRHLKLLLMSFVLVFVLSPGKAHAAGSAVVSVESSGSITAGGDIALRFYLTPSGANAYSTEINVSLSNLSVVSGSANGSAFVGFAGFTSGGSIGSTNFSLAASSSGQTGPTAGVSGKSLMYTVTVKAGSAASGQVTLSGAAAYDGNLEAMAASSQNHSITITCPSGQTGTPPNCTTPTPPPTDNGSGSGNDSTTTPPSGTGTTTYAPNTVAVRGPDEEASTPVIADESQFVTLASDEYIGKTEADLFGDSSSTAKSKTAWLNKTTILSIIAVLALLGAVILLMKAKKMRKAHRHSNIMSPSVSNTINPSHNSGEIADKPKDDGPTIIHPQK